RIEARFLADEYHDRRRQNLVNVFEYMIGNTEYSLVNPEPGKNCCHNADILSATGTPPYIALPFDFDFSGLVNAPYAEPNPRYPVRSVRTRYFKGLCHNNDLLPETLQFFRDRKASLLEAIERIREYSPVANQSARSVRNYIEAFYEIIEDPEMVRERLVEKCLEPEVAADLTS
ncbi:MAG: hypothetical protein JJ992_15715, partial [Planctomycetes bacterium]|nr:hypothetical protein [Planctomycetota bacterium]